MLSSLLLYWFLYFIRISFKQKNTSTGTKALENVVMLADVIRSTLMTDDDNSVNFSISREFISKYLKHGLLIVSFMSNLSIGIDAQLLSQADIEEGMNVNFPLNEIKFSVQSEISNSIIST